MPYFERNGAFTLACVAVLLIVTVVAALLLGRAAERSLTSGKFREPWVKADLFFLSEALA